MRHSTEKTELRELADLEIENVSGGAVGAILYRPTYLTEEKDTAPKRVHFDLR